MMASKPAPSWHDLSRDWRLFCAFGLGSGLAPRAPGTWGSLVAAVIYFVALQALAWPWQLAIIIVTACIGVYLCGYACQKLNVHDHPGIVWDEFVGFWIAGFALPDHGLSVLIAFALFRLFDIWKPWPISALDRSVGGGWGVMVDDLVAGVLAAIVAHLGFWFYPF